MRRQYNEARAMEDKTKTDRLEGQQGLEKKEEKASEEAAQKARRAAFLLGQERVKGLGITSIVFGSLAILFSFGKLLPIPFALFGLAFGLAGLLSNAGRKKNLAIIGTVLTAVGLFMTMLVMMTSLTGSLTHTAQKKLAIKPKTSTSSYIADPQKPNIQIGNGTRFAWNMQDFRQLGIGDGKTGAGGSSYAAIINHFGKPQSDVDHDSTDAHPANKEVIYQVSDPDNIQDQRQVRLDFFQQEDGGYLLYQAEEHNIGDSNVDIAGLKNAISYQDFKNLVIGDPGSANPGTSVDKITEDYGYPAIMTMTSASYHTAGGTAQSLECKLIYQNIDKSGQKMTLHFSQGDNLTPMLNYTDISKN